MDKKMLYVAGSVGGLIGGYVPVLFGAGGFSVWSVVGSGVGGIGAIVAVYRFGR